MKGFTLVGSSCAAAVIFAFCTMVMVSRVESVPLLDVFRSGVMGFAACGLFFFAFILGAISGTLSLLNR